MGNRRIFNKKQQLRSSSNVVICLLSLVFCISVSEQALSVNSKNSSVPSKAIKTSQELAKYPPPPTDKSQLPKPIQKQLQAFEDLCLLDSLEEQTAQFEKVMKDLKKTGRFYLENYYMQVNLELLGSLLGMLFGNMETHFKYWDKKHRPTNLSNHLLFEYILNYNLPDEATAEDMTHSWAHSVYKGFDCLAHGSLPDKKSL